MRIKVTHSIDDLASDLRRIPVLASRDVRAAVRHGTMTGNLVAKENARRTAGRHGKHYHRAFSWDQPRQSLFGGAGWSGEYGPEAGRPQGDMSFEEGSRNQPPHGDLEKSRAGAIGVVAQDVRRSMDDWFWPGRG
ncbi:hypothetical protein [Pimelobacter simplex]|uniref:hypothetical protein n=1 Tax=Nocardioides simplex TaxID=2045 RepID=UPI00214FE526|nr:hypothetical protein [Pimelobacter simplex]UUW88399.1 hypothetical protein M0M43_22005 [Pimelobacter simplex]UUW97903.1 hypothetical protein M0M48_10650 [Pimelobacter simplex]